MSDAKFVTVAEAAALRKTPKTTIYRWIASKAVASQRNGQMMLVSLADVSRAAAARRAGGFPEIPEKVTEKVIDNEKVGTGTEQQPAEPAAIKGAPGAKALDGETAAILLKRFEAGATPVQVAIENRITLDRVMALHAEWKRAREETEPPANPLAERVSRLEALFRTIEDEKIDPMMAVLDRLERGQFALAEKVARLDAVPGPTHRDDFKCGHCGAVGFYGVPVRCTYCGREQVWGFHPQQR